MGGQRDHEAEIQRALSIAEQRDIAHSPRIDSISATPTAWASALILFAGPGTQGDLASQLRDRGIRTTAVDTKVGGQSHDVLREDVGPALLRRIRRREFDFVFIATPCASYSVAHRPQLRSRRRVAGLDGVPNKWRSYLAKHNRLAMFTADAIEAAHGSGTAWALENPADRGLNTSVAWWRRYADHAPLWLMEDIARVLRATGASLRTFAQCAFQAKVQKYTTIAHSTSMDAWLHDLDARGCDHGTAKHEEVAHGRADDGSSRSAAAAAYPPAMNAYLAEKIAAWARSRHDRRSLTTGPRADAGRGGRIVHGPGLHHSVASLCEDARHTAPRFASMRNRRPAESHDLRKEALPGDLHDPPQPTRPRGGKIGRARDQRQSEAAASDKGEGGAGDARRRRLAAGPVTIAELYNPGVYEDVVMKWMRDADAAARDRTRVATVTIGQEDMPMWARGIVWDCADPENCVPVSRSDRHSVFKGKRQVDRAALREVARKLNWHDTDIVDQIGEGGVEARSTCELITVLAFHHRGLVEHVEKAEKVVQADWKEEWADRPVRHLPFVPCRVLPRNVVMQERSRLVDDGDGSPPSLEAYLKARITQDSSNGGDSSVNAGVSDEDKAVLLPTVQQLGRGIAIIDTASDGTDRAAAYVVDAESAYRFCPVQRADLWTQCFSWWDEKGNVGVCVDNRLGFGGAYAPNRFERLSTLVAAHIQSKQAVFDATQTTSGAVDRWAAERRSLQGRGELPPSSAQVACRYLQVYIDDFCGGALSDIVTPPQEVEGIHISGDQITSEGGTPATWDTRVYVHAQLAVAGLRDVGLSAAPHKVVVGDPAIALGLRVSRSTGRIDCPPLKRASMLSDIQSQTGEALRLRVDRKRAETLVGRLTNISQILPELKGTLHGGYAVTQASWVAGGRQRKPKSVQLGRHSQAQADWLELLSMAEELLEANDGVAIAPERSFPGRTLPGSITVTSDASGIDGVGGYGFSAASPGDVWILSEEWPADILAALHAAAAGRDASNGAASLSMPAAELFGMIATATAVARELGVAPTCVTAVGDCDPAVNTLNASASGNSQMRAIVAKARDIAKQWLAVSVPREDNVDADRLSHPSMYQEVYDEAASVFGEGHVHRVHLSKADWDGLREAVAHGTGGQKRQRL